MGLDVPDVVERIVRELKERAGNLTAAEAARLARWSKSRIRHVFTKRAGMNFRTARLLARMVYARDLLIHTLMTIPQIASKLGYSGRTKFDKAFKGVYGVTPAQYRRQHTAIR